MTHGKEGVKRWQANLFNVREIEAEGVKSESHIRSILILVFDLNEVVVVGQHGAFFAF